MPKKLSHLIICLLIVASAGAAPTSPQQSSLFDNNRYVNANSVLMFVSNNGLYANDQGGVFGYQYGMYYPFTSVPEIINGTKISSPLYSAGLWLGGQVGGQTRVTIADFAAEYWPGPMSGGTYIADADTVVAFRVFKLYSDSMSSNPNQDYTEWPSGMGAPIDQFGFPQLRGSQTLWCVYNDASPSRHTLSAGSSAPLGVEVRQTTWASSAAGLENTIYIEYDLFNKGNDSISDLYVGLYFDPDLGGAHDDLTGCDSSNGIFFSYNADNDDLMYGAIPPALGYKLLYGPAVPSLGDSAWSFGKMLTGKKNLHLSSYIGYPNGDDPQSAAESYNLLSGLKRNGTPLTNGSKFSYPGDPVNSTGDLDPFPGNPHGVGSVGPIDFSPGDSQSIVIKIAIGQGSDRLSSVSDLRARMNLDDSIISDVPNNDGDDLPDAYLLSQNYPNPFNPSTVIEYEVPNRDFVTLEVLNLLGQHVRTLVSETKGPGRYGCKWDGADESGTKAASGAYFYQLKIGKFVVSKKMLLIK